MHEETFSHREYTDCRLAHERCSTPLALRKKQIETTMKYHHKSIREVKIKITIPLNASEDEEKLN